MRYRKLLLFLFLSFISANAFAAVFVVTSNADSGPGTLREALTLAAANGSAAQDYIEFNLPNVTAAGRTITLVSQLPDLSSHLTVDGTTQPGLPFGQSDARVKVNTPTNNSANTVFNGSGLSVVEIYGIYIHDSADVAYSQPNVSVRIGIQLRQSNSIIIGGIGRGNMIRGFNAACMSFFEDETITVKSNLFGLTEQTDLSEGASSHIEILYCNNIAIGGITLSEGNVFFDELDLEFKQNAQNINMFIGSNNFQVIKNLVTNKFFTSHVFASVRINTYPLNDYGLTPQDIATSATVNFNIVNNLSANGNSSFVINAFKGLINFTKNYSGIDRDGVTKLNMLDEYLSYDQNFLVIENCLAQVNVGSDNSSDANFIAYCNYAVRETNSTSVLVRKNEYECVVYKAYVDDNVDKMLPPIAITTVTSSNNQTVISGTSDPNAIVDVYSSESCDQSQCSIRKYIETVKADNSGKWVSTATLLTGLFYVSSTVNNRTSEYKTYEIITSNAVVMAIRCLDYATITGLKVPAGLTYYWIDESGTIVSNELDLKVSKTGKYQLVLGSGCITSDWFEIYDDRIGINDNGLSSVDPGCGKNNGAIVGLYPFDPENRISITQWLDASGKVIGTTPDVDHLPEGSYTFKVFTADGCEANFGPVTLKNTTGPNINQSTVKIQPTGCSQSTGYITGITATGFGTLKYSWLNSSQQQVGTDPDLINQPPGMYYLQVSDGSACPPVAIPGITIPGLNDVKIDESNVKKGYSDCTQSLGYISGIKVTGSGTLTYAWVNINGVSLGSTVDITGLPINKYRLMVSNGSCSPVYSAYYEIDQSGTTYLTTAVKLIPPTCSSPGSITGITESNATSNIWKDANGVIVGHDLDLLNIPAGDYTLTIINLCGIAITTQPFHLPSPDQNYPAYASTIKNSCYQQNNGSVTLNADAQPKAFRWVNSAGQTISDQQNLTGVAGGTYQLYLTSQAGCETLYQTYNITESTAIGINGQGLVTNEQCGLKNGGVSGIAVTGGLQPYVYQWTNDAGNPVGSDISIKNLSAGNYKLNITDAGCSNVNLPFTITNETQMLPTPSVSDIQLCSSGTALVTVNNPLDQVSYRLYNTQTGMQPLDEQKSGRFTVTITADRSYFISEVIGTCESIKAQLKVKVGLTDLHIANTFTPNSDGINDYWAISGLQKYPNSVTQVYTRNGQKVFESKGYAVPFDGTFNGKKLPVGVYYYIINLSANCSVLSGSLTIIR